MSDIEATWVRVGLIIDGDTPIEKVVESWAEAARDTPDIMLMWVDAVEEMPLEEARKQIKEAIPGDLH